MPLRQHPQFSKSKQQQRSLITRISVELDDVGSGLGQRAHDVCHGLASLQLVFNALQDLGLLALRLLDVLLGGFLELRLEQFARGWRQLFATLTASNRVVNTGRSCRSRD